MLPAWSPWADVWRKSLQRYKCVNCIMKPIFLRNYVFNVYLSSTSALQTALNGGGCLSTEEMTLRARKQKLASPAGQLVEVKVFRDVDPDDSWILEPRKWPHAPHNTDSMVRSWYIMLRIVKSDPATLPHSENAPSCLLILSTSRELCVVPTAKRKVILCLEVTLKIEFL